MPASRSNLEATRVNEHEDKWRPVDGGESTEMPFKCGRCRNEHETLEERYDDDRPLLEFYQRGPLRHGWAGRLDCTEREYLRRKRREMRKSPSDEFFASDQDV